MTASGVVCRTAGDGRVEVEFVAPRGCRGCEGVCLWRRLPAIQRAELKTSLPLRSGDPVDVRLPHHYVLLGALFVHGLPLAALLVGGVAGVAATGSDLGCLAGVVIGLALAALAAPRLRRRVERATLRALTVELQRAHAHTHSL
jgi:positive regulator of sigma E activity